MKNREIKELIEGWLKDGVISNEQAMRMAADIREQTSQKSQHKLVSAISTIGGLALALGFLLLIAANWSTFGRTVKLVFAVLLPVVPLLIAYWLLIARGSTRMYARAANLVGIILIGGALALIGQIYNLDANMLNFFGLWTLLSAPFIFAFRKEENALVTLILLGVTIFFACLDAFADGRAGGELLIFTLSLIYLAYSYLLYRFGSHMRHSAVWGSIARVMRLAAGAFGTVVLFLMTFMFYAESVTEVLSLDPLLATPLSVFLNLLYIAFLFFVLVRAYRYEEDQTAAMVLRWFGIYLIVKYITLFGGMFATGLFFVVGGILFIAGGWILEHKQQDITAYMKRRFVTSHESGTE